MSLTYKEMQQEADKMERWTHEEMATKMNMIHNIDCLEFMKQVPDGYFDLVLTDPPYGINESGQTNKTRSCLAKSKDYGNKSWDKKPPDKEHFMELIRVSKQQIIFGANHFIDLIPYRSSCWLVWDKDNGNTDFADSELAWTNFKTAVRNYKFKWQGMLQQDMANKEERHHPTQKPTELFKMILKDYASENAKVFDAFMGSGTTAIACKSLGLEWCGCELEPDYVEIANKRLGKVQTSIFALTD